MRKINWQLMIVVPMFSMLLCIVMLSGCRSPITAGTKVVSYPSTEVHHQSRMVKNKIEITEYNVSEVNDLMRVQISAENLTREDFQFEYRFRWFDDEGFEQKTQLSTWNSVHSVAKGTIYLEGIAPNEDVADYEFIIRFPDRW